MTDTAPEAGTMTADAARVGRTALGEHVSPKLVLFALALGGFSIGTTEFAAMALVPYFSADLGVTQAHAAGAISAYALGVVVGAPTLALLGSLLSRRILLVLLMAAFAVFNVVSALSPNFGLMLVFRFLAGLPHGAYFGVAALVAATVVAPNRRASAVSLVLFGLTVATTLGVPLSNVLGQTVGWRWSFAVTGVIATITAISIFVVAPRDTRGTAANMRTELAALKNRQVWLTLATGAIGFGGFFGVYTYIASTVIESMHAPASFAPVVLFVAGVGMMVWTLVFGWLSDRSVDGAAFISMIVGFFVLLAYPLATGNMWTMLIAVFALGIVCGLSPVLQTRAMDVAGDAKQLPAAMNQAAFNTANALGPALAALAIDRGFGFPSSGYVGAALSMVGIIIFAFTVYDARRNKTA